MIYLDVLYLPLETKFRINIKTHSNERKNNSKMD